MNRSFFSILLAAALMLAVVSAAAGQNAGSGNLRNPAALKETSPATYKAKFDTTAGVFVIEVHRDWAPNGADRFYNLVKNGFYDNLRFFRVVPNFMVQFGIHGDPAVQKNWVNATIPAGTSQSRRRRPSSISVRDSTA